MKIDEHLLRNNYDAIVIYTSRTLLDNANRVRDTHRRLSNLLHTYTVDDTIVIYM